MFDNTLHIPLKFYTAVEKQDRFKPFVVNRRFVQWADSTHLPEFQVRVALNDNLTALKLVDVLDDSETAITTSGSDFYEVDFTSYTYVIYDQTLALTGMPYGDYYLKLTTTTGTYYSEVFSIGDIVGKTIFEYYGINDIGGVDYTNTPKAQYKNTLILDTTLAKPEYTVEEEAVEDGEGNVLVTFQRLVKKFKLWFYAPEHIADACSMIPLHDYVTLTTNYGEANQETGLIYDVAVTTEWMDTKGLAKITIEFRDQPIIKTTCANNIT